MSAKQREQREASHVALRAAYNAGLTAHLSPGNAFMPSASSYRAGFLAALKFAAASAPTLKKETA